MVTPNHVWYNCHHTLGYMENSSPRDAAAMTMLGSTVHIYTPGPILPPYLGLLWFPARRPMSAIFPPKRFHHPQLSVLSHSDRDLPDRESQEGRFSSTGKQMDRKRAVPRSHWSREMSWAGEHTLYPTFCVKDSNSTRWFMQAGKAESNLRLHLRVQGPALNGLHFIVRPSASLGYLNSLSHFMPLLPLSYPLPQPGPLL